MSISSDCTQPDSSSLRHAHTHLYIESSNSQKHCRVLSRCQRITLSSPVFIRVQEIEFGLSDFHSKCLYPMSHLPDYTGLDRADVQ